MWTIEGVGSRMLLVLVVNMIPVDIVETLDCRRLMAYGMYRVGRLMVIVGHVKITVLY